MAHEEMVSPDLITAVTLRIEKDKIAVTVEVTRNGNVTDVILVPDTDDYDRMVSNVITAIGAPGTTAEVLECVAENILEFYEAECHIYQMVF